MSRLNWTIENRTNHHPEQERIAYLEQKIQTKDEVLAELMAEHVALKKGWGTLTGVWVTAQTDYVRFADKPVLPNSGLKSKQDGGHFCGHRALHSALE